MSKWQLEQQKLPQSVDEVKKILLKNREITDFKSFLNPTPPTQLPLKQVGINEKEMTKAVKRIKAAQEKGQQVLIFGDYDADGICATAILWLTLYQLDLEVLPFIPHREKHGYGVSEAAIDEIVAQDSPPDLIITVDNGIVAYEPVQRLVEDEGIEVIITDHHQPETKDDQPIFPPAQAIVHTTQLCGATVSWMLARELDKNLAKDQLDLAGIATIADQVPLIGANRSFAKYGLKALSQTKKVGLKQLFAAAKLDKDNISSGTIGFGIAPRINAMGRLKHGLDALRLLCTKNKSRAKKLVAELMQTNIKRQDLTSELLEDAVVQAEKQQQEKIIIVSSPEYHQGIVGLIAGRLMEQYYKPAIAISVNNQTAKASARSVTGVNIVEILREVQDDLLEVGGHPMAAGFSVEAAKVGQVQDKLFELTRSSIKKELLTRAIKIDTELPWNLISDELMEMVEQFAPFGRANPRPNFLLKELNILSIQTMGSENQHLKLVLGKPDLDNPSESARTLDVLAWRKSQLAQDLREGDLVSVVGRLEFNYWNGKRNVQMVLKDIRDED